MCPNKVFFVPYFPAFGLNTERYFVSLHIQPECGKIRTRKNSVFGHFSRSVDNILSIRLGEKPKSILFAIKSRHKKDNEEIKQHSKLSCLSRELDKGFL